MTTVLIPAKYPSERWKNSIPKHSAWLGSCTIMWRLLTQCDQYQTISKIVTPNAEFDAPYRPALMNATLINKRLLEAIELTKDLWSDRTIILLGDVILSDAAAEMIFTDDQDLTFWGNSAEIFAVTFTHKAHDRIRRAMDIALKYLGEHPEDEGAGKLWSLYKAVVGHPQEKELTQWYPYFYYITDWSTDIDTVEEYETFQREVVEKGLL